MALGEFDTSITVKAPAASSTGANAGSRWGAVYCAWAAIAIAISFLQGGWSDENITRLGVLAFIALQFACRHRLVNALAHLPPRTRFIVYCTMLAAVVEGLHMISKPVFDTLRVSPGLPLADAVYRYAVDLAFTLPAYLAIFATIWIFIARYRYGLWTYIVVAGLGQSLGDGGIYFLLGAPQLAPLLPYVMTNYHAINVLPFVAVQKALPEARNARAARLLMIPTLIAVYFACGAIIQSIGRACGFATG